MTNDLANNVDTNRESIAYDVVIVGAGPAGLSAAIHIKQLNPSINVCVLDKGADIGAHIISGGVIDPIALNELIPDWKTLSLPFMTQVVDEKFFFLNEKGQQSVPHALLPSSMKNKGHYIVSLSQMMRWLSEKAQDIGIDVFAGFTATEVLYGKNNEVIGVATGDMGVAQDGTLKPTFSRGITLLANYTLFAEGTRGYLGQQLIKHYQLDKGCDPQSYALGVKEVWKINHKNHHLGMVVHAAGYPLDDHTYGGAFIYHLPNDEVALGYIVGLDYQNPYISPFQVLQAFKKHPFVAPLLEEGQRISYGARAMTAGGIQALPKMVFPGGALIGCEAGFMDGAKLKGIHCAMKSGMLAAQAVIKALQENRSHDTLDDYLTYFKSSWLYKELEKSRNFKPIMSHSLLKRSLLFGIDQVLFHGHAPWTLHRQTPDYASTKKAKEVKPIVYEKPDNQLTFDVPSSVYLSATDHEKNQPIHLVVHDKAISVKVDYEQYAAMSTRYCPAGVYEYIIENNGQVRLKINATNCLHCKTCDIKDPSQNITWTPPEGGGGPHYTNM